MTTMKITNTLTDEAILAEMGQRIAKRRLEFQLTQAALAREAGIAKRTVERVEAGDTAQISTIVRIFRVLGLLPVLDQMLPESKPRPIDTIKRKGKIRKRATSGARQSKKEVPWTWGEEP